MLAGLPHTSGIGGLNPASALCACSLQVLPMLQGFFPGTLFSSQGCAIMHCNGLAPSPGCAPTPQAPPGSPAILCRISGMDKWIEMCALIYWHIKAEDTGDERPKSVYYRKEMTKIVRLLRVGAEGCRTGFLFTMLPIVCISCSYSIYNTTQLAQLMQ